MMRKVRQLAVMAAFCLLLPRAAGAESITWQSEGQLRADPVFGVPAFYADGTSGNTVTVDAGPQLSGDVYGAINGNGNVQGNKVVVGGHADFNNMGQSSWVIGGFAHEGNATGNNLDIDGLTSYIYLAAGGQAYTGNATGNSVTVSNVIGSSPIPSPVPSPTPAGVVEILGGVAVGDGETLVTASKNSVSIIDSMLTTGGANNISGGNAIYGEAVENSVTVKNSAVVEVTGGYAVGSDTLQASAARNTVSLIHSSTESVVGGHIAHSDKADDKGGNAVGNSVTVGNGSTVYGEVIGGSVHQDHFHNAAGVVKGNADDNKVVVSDSTVDNGGNNMRVRIRGGVAGSGDVTGNSVSIVGSALSNTSESGPGSNNQLYVTGGDATNGGNASGNRVSISGTTLSNTAGLIGIYGGYVNNVAEGAGGGASGNGVDIGTGTTTRSASTSTADNIQIVGGYVNNSAAGTEGSASGNTVTVSGGTIGGNAAYDRIRGSYVYNTAGNSKGSAANSTVNIFGGDITARISGGEVQGSGIGSAVNNSVNIFGGTINGDVYGGRAANGNADGNTVNISDGIVAGDVYGGYAHSEDGNIVASASNNAVIISGGTVTGTVYGGYVNTSAQDSAINNRVVIRGNPNLDAAALNGAGTGGLGETFQGNTLSMENDRTARVDTVQNFENFSFVLPANAGSGYVALQSDNITFGGKINGKDEPSKVSDISFQGGGTPLQPGDGVALFRKLDGTAYTTTDAELTGLAGRTIPGRKGISLLYEYALDNTGTARVDSVRVNPQTKALSEGRVAGAAFLNQGGDLLAYKGIGVAVAGANAAHGLSAFALTSGGWSSYDTGSHVDVSGVSLLAGLAVGGETPAGRITGGGFFESGWGNYDGHNSFSGYASVKGSGDTSYVGGGAFARLDLKDTGPGHFYGEISGRIGAQYTDFSSGNLRDPVDGRKADYSMEGAYYGLHTGLGYVWDINESASLDLSGKYFWTHQKGGSVNILGDPFTFDDVDSHRVRAGGRFSYAVNEHFTPYIGAAYEYEFSGEAKASTYGRSIDAPDLTGSTGIGEIGVTLLGGDKAPVSLDLGVQGYTGIRQGVTGSLQLKLEF
jgi:hypothetical protein